MKFTIVWDERKSIDIKASSEKEAKEKFYNNEFCYADADCNYSGFVEIYEFKE